MLSEQSRNIDLFQFNVGIKWRRKEQYIRLYSVWIWEREKNNISDYTQYWYEKEKRTDISDYIQHGHEKEKERREITEVKPKEEKGLPCPPVCRTPDLPAVVSMWGAICPWNGFPVAMTWGNMFWLKLRLSLLHALKVQNMNAKHIHSPCSI